MATPPKNSDSKPATGPASDAKEAPTFDARLARLETIVAELEGGGLSLERSIERYQEGTALLKDCRALLSGFQQRVEELTNDADGGTKPYAADPDARDRA